MIATETEKIIINRLVIYKDYPFVRSAIHMLKSEEQRKKLIEWLDNHPDCSKEDIDIEIIHICF